VALTRYEYEVDAFKPESENVVVVPLVVPICANDEQPAPAQRSTLYPVTPTLSVEAVQVSPICELEEAAAFKFDGAVGGVVSAPAGVVAEAIFE
jgi:hypothetical protein